MNNRFLTHRMESVERRGLPTILVAELIGNFSNSEVKGLSKYMGSVLRLAAVQHLLARILVL